MSKTNKTALLVSSSLGVVLGVSALLLQMLLSHSSPVRHLLQTLNGPVDAFIRFYAGIFHGGNTDQCIGIGVSIWVLYWLLLGVLFTLCIYWGARRFARAFLAGP